MHLEDDFLFAAPSVPLRGFTFHLLSFEPCHEWKPTGRLMKDGSPEFVRSDELMFDDFGERVRCRLGLRLTDASGISTEPYAPLVYEDAWFDIAEVRFLSQRLGGTVELMNPRVEFHERVRRINRSTGEYEFRTMPLFEFDGITMGLEGR